MSSSLNDLCNVLTQVSDHIEVVTAEIERLLHAGECGQARLVLESAELRFGPWLVDGSALPPAKVQLGATHLLVLLCENDLPAARMLVKRFGGTPPPVLQQCCSIYEKLWNTDTVAATEMATAFRQDAALAQFPLLLRTLELFLARIRVRQMQFLQRAYSSISAESFGKALGLSSTTEIEQFCKMTPNVFEIRDGFIHPQPLAPVETGDVAAQIERLTKLIVFLESETVTYINPKVPSAATGSSQN